MIVDVITRTRFGGKPSVYGKQHLISRRSIVDGLFLVGKPRHTLLPVAAADVRTQLD